MTTDELLQIDCRGSDSKVILQKALNKIKPFKKYNNVKDVPLYKLEKFIKLVCNKYGYWVRLLPDTNSNDEFIIWRCTIIDLENLKSICDVYGCTIYESIAKTVIKLYAITKNKRKV